MSLWKYAVAAALLCPATTVAQTQQTGGATGGAGGGGFAGSGTGGAAGNTGMGSFGRPNTTMLGSQIDLNFNTVFGTSPSIANTDPDPFAAYRPTDTGTAGNGGMAGTGGFGTTNRGATTNRNNLSGATFGGNGVAGNALNRTGTGGLTGAANRLGGGGGAAGALNRGGALGGGLGGNRMALGGNMGGNFANRGMMGMNMLGGSSTFLGGSTNNMAGTTQSMGYVVNIDPATAVSTPPTVGTTINTEVRQRLASAPVLQGVTNFEVLMQGNRAILRGTAPNDAAKRMATAMALLEPGIYEVDNQLVVAAQLPAPKPE